MNTLWQVAIVAPIFAGPVVGFLAYGIAGGIAGLVGGLVISKLVHLVMTSVAKRRLKNSLDM